MPGLAAKTVILFFALAILGDAHARSPINVVVTVKPIHSLIAGVMQGVAQPHLLIEGAGSPHGYVLKPSGARALQQAAVIFWTGPEMETFLADSLQPLGKNARIVETAAIDGIDQSAHAHDPHIWLDPRNGQAIVRVAVQTLAAADTENADTYRANGARLVELLAALESEVALALRDIQSVPYIVFHDAYGHFERRFGVHSLASVTTGHDRAPGARRIKALRRMIEEEDVRCVFAEPQFEPKFIAPLIEGSDARIGLLDPIGADISPGPDLYFTLIRQLANALKGCLEQPPAGHR